MVKRLISLVLVISLFGVGNILSVNASYEYNSDIYKLNSGWSNPFIAELSGNTLTVTYKPVDSVGNNGTLKVGDNFHNGVKDTDGIFTITADIASLDISAEYDVSLFVQENNSSDLVKLAIDDCFLQYSDDIGWHFKKWGNYDSNIVKYKEYKAIPSNYVNSEIESFTQDLVKGYMDNYSKAYAVYSWVCDNIYYDKDYENGVTGATNITAYDTFKNRVTTCEGYTNLIKAMMTAINFDTKIVRQIDGNKGHMWNEVSVDGRWLIIDSTFGSLNTFKDGFLRAERDSVNKLHYFDMTLNNFSKEHLITDYALDYDILAFDNHSSWAKDELIEAIQLGLIRDNYVQGFTRNITRGEFCKIITAYVGKQLQNKEIFGDLSAAQIQTIMSSNMYGAKIPFVSEQGKMTSDIIFAYVNGIVNGKDSNYFDVDGLITRQDAACMIYRTISYLHSISNDFRFKTGVSKIYKDRKYISNYAMPSVLYLSKVNILLGDEQNYFRPQGSITVEQTYLIFLRLLKSYI